MQCDHGSYDKKRAGDVSSLAGGFIALGSPCPAPSLTTKPVVSTRARYQREPGSLMVMGQLRHFVNAVEVPDRYLKMPNLSIQVQDEENIQAPNARLLKPSLETEPPQTLPSGRLDAMSSVDIEQLLLPTSPLFPLASLGVYNTKQQPHEQSSPRVT